MKYTLKLNSRSVNALKKRIQIMKSNIPILMERFLKDVAEWIIEKAKWYVENSDIGANVKADINDHWSYTISGKSAKIVNDSDKAVFVEFGVGSMGAMIPHDMAKSEGYQYNVNDHTYWVFTVEDEEDVDMHQGYQTKNAPDGQIYIITKGSWRVMYAYQSIVDAKDELRKVGGGEIGRLWKKAKRGILSNGYTDQ